MILFKCVLSSRDTLHPVEKRQGKEQRTIFWRNYLPRIIFILKNWKINIKEFIIVISSVMNIFIQNIYALIFLSM